MPFVPLQNFGRYGVVSDTLNTALPIGTWTNARNIRFTGVEMQKMLEPTTFANLVDEAGDPIPDGYWMQGWSDGFSTFLVVATPTALWYLLRGDENDPGYFVDVSRPDGYSPEGQWDSFSWGDTVIFNNQVDPPQIFNGSTFEDLPNWGLLSTASDISNNNPPSRQVRVSCRILRPYKSFLVACGITEAGEYQPNAVWWSDRTELATFSTPVTNGGPPDWDYESPASLSGKSEVSVGNGEITCAELLNENVIIYTERSATAMQFTGGGLVMSFRRLFEKGAAGIHCVAEFNNQHFVISRDQIYLHNGSKPIMIAKDRVEEEFFRRIGKGGRFGGGIVPWERVQVIKNPDRKEIYVIYGGEGFTGTGDGTGVDPDPDPDPTPDPSAPCADYPNIGLSTDAELLYSSNTVTTTGLTAGPNGMIAVEGDVIVAHDSNTEGVISKDGGQTWSAPFTWPVFGSNSDTSKVLYSGGRILVSIGEGGSFFTQLFKSEDDGATFVSCELPGPDNNMVRSSEFVSVDPNTGNVIVGGRNNSDGRYYVWTDISGDPTSEPQWENATEGTTSPPFVDNCEWCGDYVVFRREVDSPFGPDGYTGSILSIHAYTDGSNPSQAVWQGVAPVYTGATVGGSLGGANADHRHNSRHYQSRYVFFQNDSDKGVELGYNDYRILRVHLVEPEVLRLNAENAAIPQVDYDMERSICMPRVATAPNYFVLFAAPDAPAQSGGTKTAYLKWGTQVDGSDLSSLITVNLNFTPTYTDGLDTNRFNILWSSGNEFIVSYIAKEDGLVKVERIDLCAEVAP